MVRHLVERTARIIKRRHASVAPAGQIDGREVERQAKQVVAQRAGDELVDVVAILPRHAADDVAGSDVVVRLPLASNSTGLRKPWIRPM